MNEDEVRAVSGTVLRSCRRHLMDGLWERVLGPAAVPDPEGHRRVRAETVLRRLRGLAR